MTFITRQMFIDQLVELDNKCEQSFAKYFGNDVAEDAAIESYFLVTHKMPGFDEVSDPYSFEQSFSDEEQALITWIDDKWEDRMNDREGRLHMDVEFGLCSIIPLEEDGNSMLHNSEMIFG